MEFFLLMDGVWFVGRSLKGPELNCTVARDNSPDFTVLLSDCRVRSVFRHRLRVIGKARRGDYLPPEH